MRRSKPGIEERLELLEPTARAAEVHAGGMSWVRIPAMLGVPRGTLADWWRRFR